jgi:hypothetical protein
VDTTESVLERMAVTEGTTLAVARIDGGKIRVTSLLWPEPKVILKDEVLEIRNVDGRLHIACKPRDPDEWNPRSSLMTLAPGTAATDKVIEA